MNSLLLSQLFDNETFYDAFARDLSNAKQSVIIESPFITTKRMKVLLPIFRKLRGIGVLVVVNTWNTDEHDTEYAAQASQAIATFQDMGIVVLYTVKHHRKLAIIDREILWEGSLNILSQNDSCEIMRRIESEQLAKQTIEFVGLNSYLNSSEVVY